MKPKNRIAMENEWISVKDRLPETKGRYFICQEKEYYPESVNFYPIKIDGSHWINDGFAVFPTHWMPLPEPPKPNSYDQKTSNPTSS